MSQVIEAFYKTCRDFPENVAINYLGKNWKYRELLELVEKFSDSLLRIGLSKGEKVVIYLPNCPQWIISWLALLKCGLCAVPVSPIYTPSDVSYIINDSGAETVICLDTNFRYIYQILDKTAVKRVIITNVCDLLPLWKRIIGIAFDKIPRGKIKKGGNFFLFKKLLKEGKEEKRTFTNEPSAIFYTGGTTGTPKGVPYSSDFIFEVAYWQRKLREKIPKGEDILIQGSPLFHSFGMAMGMGALLSADTMILLPKVNLDALLVQIERYKVKSLFGVPALFRMILDHERIDFYDLSSLKYCCSGGDALPEEVARRWKKMFSVPLYQGYGSTETGGISGVMMGEDPPEGSCGRLLPYQEIRFNEEGELLVTSENMPKEYWNKPDETKRCFLKIDGKIWYRTGDIIKIDKDGWLFFIDRSSDIIKHKGYRVSCSEIEKVLQDHPAVKMAAVVGVPDRSVGEKIKAYVVLRDDVKGLSAYELIRWCRQRLTSYKVPHIIEFRDMLPKSKVGKLLRRELRQWERKRQLK